MQLTQVEARASAKASADALVPALTSVECYGAGLASPRFVAEIKIFIAGDWRRGDGSGTQSNFRRCVSVTSMVAAARFTYGSIFLHTLLRMTHELQIFIYYRQ
ncbi:hypothetical protein BJY54_006961 [Streptomyces nodosus]|uniref:hypothetical protein n=1 Tax=Streptomyces nodosus TaxID=40318 RepID=UPI00123D1B45|nr:hypothetical protein [Streptomyces nodosus]MBB4796257.1 hypothetical protein [Streptomyces nodosus]